MRIVRCAAGIAQPINRFKWVEGQDAESSCIMKHRECLIGLPAKYQAVVNSANMVFAFKCLIGWKFTDKEVKDDMKHW
jgi:molecular chaperone DnaK (HSP70)